MSSIKLILISVASVSFIIAVFSSRIYDWGTSCACNWGWERIAGIRQRNKHWALPLSQGFLFLCALFCLVAAVIIK